MCIKRICVAGAVSPEAEALRFTQTNLYKQLHILERGLDLNN
jgi:hypothetical protein